MSKLRRILKRIGLIVLIMVICLGLLVLWWGIHVYINYEKRTLLFKDVSYLGHTVEVYELGRAGPKLFENPNTHYFLVSINGVEQFSWHAFYGTDKISPDSYSTLNSDAVFCQKDDAESYIIGIYTSIERENIHTVAFDASFTSTEKRSFMRVYNADLILPKDAYIEANENIEVFH